MPHAFQYESAAVRACLPLAFRDPFGASASTDAGKDASAGCGHRRGKDIAVRTRRLWVSKSDRARWKARGDLRACAAVRLRGESPRHNDKKQGEGSQLNMLGENILGENAAHGRHSLVAF
jgi:hypothetical protein